VRRTVALLAAVALAGCATWAPRTTEPMLSGRIAVQVEAEPGLPAQAMTAQFELTGNAATGFLTLSSALGTRLGEASWSPAEVVLLKAGGTRSTYPDLDALTRDLLGEALPVGALFDWLAGRPWPAAPSAPSQPPAPAGFRQLGWAVDLARFGDGLVVARRDAPPAVTVRAKMDPPAPTR
jgi:outer membrane lipoprotein LolB